MIFHTFLSIIRHHGQKIKRYHIKIGVLRLFITLFYPGRGFIQTHLFFIPNYTQNTLLQWV